MYRGSSIRIDRLGEGLAEVCFDRSDADVNKLDRRTVEELRAATAVLDAARDVRGILVTSAKDAFIVGADIFEFRELFSKQVEEIARFNVAQSAVFTAFADLPVPSVAAISGLALGGGLEMALATDDRIMSGATQIGFPEVGLGLFPGFGGTVRLPRLAGVGTALEWIVSGKPRDAAAALAAGVVDAISPRESLREAALARLRELAAGGAWRERRTVRRGAAAGADDPAIGALRTKAGAVAHHYPAALAAIDLVTATARLSRDDALAAEARAFAHIASTPSARALVQVFVNDQAIRRKARVLAQRASRPKRAAVLGAGIMGGGIAYTSAARGVPVLMKDVAEAALALGTREASRLLDKQVRSGRLDEARAAAIESTIAPTLTYDRFDEVDIVVEAIVEDLAIKQRVLAEVESMLGAAAVIASNTSSLSIDALAGALQRPEQFVGMHFFNPVPVMPLVEVIRGRLSGEAAVGVAVGYATAMGKTPVVLRDCPGFLVNRILNAYFVGFSKLLRDGADFERVDDAMQAFGWPMGPAQLQDVVGMDTSSHVFALIAAAYPQRVALDFIGPLKYMADRKRFGQKTGSGLYRYAPGPDGRVARTSDPEAHALIAELQPNGPRPFGDGEIVERLMIPMVLEAATCLAEGICESAGEIDMALVLGLGFPKHHGGALAWADAIGMEGLLERCEHYRPLGTGYQAPPELRRRADERRGFYD